MKSLIRVGTRKSKLAMIQTQLVVDKIKNNFPDLNIEIVPIDTKGDQLLDRSLASFGGKGVFTRELEDALLYGDIDLAVHSAKDMPMEFPNGLGICSVIERANPCDVLVTTNGVKAKDLPLGSVIGTSSLRREIQIKNINPQVNIKVIRGNVQTRLNKLKEGQYDGILLAAAGLERLQYEETQDFKYEYLDVNCFLPAAGQGILAVEGRVGDLEEIFTAIHSKEAACLLTADRTFLSHIGGSCNAPAASYSSIDGDKLSMSVMYVKEGIYHNYATGDISLNASENNVWNQDEFLMEQAKQLGKQMAREVNVGMVYLVGAGPGDQGLTTQKALECVQKAQVIVYDNLVSSSLLNQADEQAEIIYAGKRAANHYLRQEETNELLIEKAKEGKIVVRLKGGDPFIFGRGAEEAQVLEEANIPFEIVPGVSSSYAAAAYAGIPVTHRDAASSFHVITGHEGSHKSESTLHYDILAKEEGTLVFMMGLNNLPNITKMLIANGKSPDTKVGVIQEGTTARQKLAVGTLDTIVEEVKKKGIKTPAVTVIGDVVAYAPLLDWYGKKPLSGKSVLITGTKEMTAKLSKSLTKLGAEPIEFSLIATKRILEDVFLKAAASIKEYTWAVFTSSNGVEAFFSNLKENKKDIRSLHHLKIAAIGEGTAKALEEKGIVCDFIPSRYSSKDLAIQWIPQLSSQDKVLLLRAKEASKELNQALELAQIEYTDAPLYETTIDTRKAEELNRILEYVDYVTFSSSSAVKAYESMVPDTKSVKAKAISIGPVTSKTAEDLGIKIHKTATTYTVEGLCTVLHEE